MSRSTCAICGALAERDFLCGACKFDEGFVTNPTHPLRALFRKYGLRCEHEKCREPSAEAAKSPTDGSAA